MDGNESHFLIEAAKLGGVCQSAAEAAIVIQCRRIAADGLAMYGADGTPDLDSVRKALGLPEPEKLSQEDRWQRGNSR